MSVTNYVKGLLPSFESSRVKDNLTNLSQEIDQFTLPSTKGMAETFPHDWKWKNKNVETLDKAIRSSYKGKVFKRDASALELIEHALVNMQTTLPLMKMQADKAFARTISSEGLTFDRAAILQFSEAATFFVNYARVMVNYLSAAELSELDGSRKVAGIAPDDEEYLLANRYTFAIALSIMCVDGKELKSEMAHIPTSIVESGNEDDMVAVVGKGKMDPFGFASLPFPLSLIYRAGLSIADWQVNRYDQAQEEANVQQYRMILLKERIENGQGDAATENALKDAEERLKLARRKITKMEEDYGIDG